MTEQIQSSAGLLSLPAIEDISKRYGMPAAAFAFTFRAVAMPQPHTEPEFVACILVAREHGLNPLTKEIYFMRSRGSGIQPIVSVDGWMKKCNENPQFDGMEFTEECDDKGALISMTCIVYRKDRNHPIKVTEHLDECRAAGGAVWKTSPRRMLRHRALTQCARYAFGFAGVMDREEFDQWQRSKTLTAEDAGQDWDGIDVPPQRATTRSGRPKRVAAVDTQTAAIAPEFVITQEYADEDYVHAVAPKKSTPPMVPDDE